MTAPRTVVVTGPESTGKTTLAARLAAALDAPLSLESARVYYDALLVRDPGTALGAADVAPIARGQIALEDAALDEAALRGATFVVRDTDLVSTVVYARHYYGACPAWIVDAARARRGARYLLCDVDVPWIPDAQRDRPTHRAELFGAFVRTLAELECDVVTLRGSWEARESVARATVEAMSRAP